MTINLKDVVKEALAQIPGDDLDAVIMFAASGDRVTCTIAGEAVPMKVMLYYILAHKEPRELFEECYSYVLAERANARGNESADPNNN